MGRKRKPKIEPMTPEDYERFIEQANAKCASCIYNHNGVCYYADDTCGFADGEDYLNEPYRNEEPEKKERCENCKWRRHEDINDGYVCVNAESDRCADWVEDYDGCECWEGKDGS